MNQPLGTPPAEVEIDARLVAALVAAQHRDLAGLAVEAKPAASGWDNVMYRLGPERAVRLPRRELGAQCILVAQRWLPRLASAVPVATPAPTRVGVRGRASPLRCPSRRRLRSVSASPAAAIRGRGASSRGSPAFRRRSARCDARRLRDGDDSCVRSTA